MIRTIALACTTALAVGALGVGPAGATAPPVPAGTISCTVKGTLTLNHPLTNTPSPSPIKLKGTAAPGAGSCDNSGVTGGKAPITTVGVKLSALLPTGASCTSLASPTLTATKLQAKFQGLNPSLKLFTVAVDNTTVASTSLPSLAPIVVRVVSPPQTKGGFVGSTITVNFALDDSAATLLGECAGTGITSLAFGNANPATLTVP